MKPESARPLIALEIGPLSERHHTGIATVAKKLALELLSDHGVEAQFFFNRSLIPREIVQDIASREGGEILWWVASRADIPQAFPCAGAPRIGIYTNHKWHRRLFPVEVQIVHDLTPITAPQFHSDEAVEFWRQHLLPDMASSDLIVAVSQSTKSDIRTWFPQLAQIPCMVAPLAPASNGLNAPVPDAAEPYILVLGTLEPRKNADVVFELLQSHPELLDRHRFVFAGRSGWGPKVDEAIEQHDLSRDVGRGRILFTGYVRDEVRDRLIQHAACVLYPSLYEGFGLPVLEALTAGAPVITGIGSSLAEAGGELAEYCDIASTELVFAALRRVLDDPQSRSTAAVERRRNWAAQFSWQATYRRIRDAALAVAAGEIVPGAA